MNRRQLHGVLERVITRFAKHRPSVIDFVMAYVQITQYHNKTIRPYEPFALGARIMPGDEPAALTSILVIFGTSHEVRTAPF